MEKSQKHWERVTACYLHSLFILADELGRELAEDLQEGQVDWRELGPAGILVLECKLDTVPSEQRATRMLKRVTIESPRMKKQDKEKKRKKKKQNRLVQRSHSLPGLDLVQAEGEGKATGQFFDAADVGRRPVQIGPLILEQLVEQLTHAKH